MSGDAANQATNVPGAAAAAAPVSGQITVAVVLLIVVLFLAVLVLYLRSMGYTGSSVSGSSRRPTTSRLVSDESASHRNALDASILESLPVAVYRVRPEECGLECAVCICELAEGEEVRFLPRCSHAFHVECIDMWFGSNSTCPLCRLPVVAAYSGTNDAASPVRDAKDQEHGCSSSSSSSSSPSTSSSGRMKELVIEIPRSRAAAEGGFSSAVSPPPSTRRGSESARTPAVERLRSLGRMVSRGRGKGVCCSTTPRPAAGSDIELGRIDDVSKHQ
ncbi:RING-H2 finger protein ATL2-like [Iris pallida]|uniref:RING-H2 finger protein ATL2-like n=1 Tax=Iris pallida TaxID=29817 RepID=A0AAX6I5Y2_IRIPA|nr:RING-H2 finger protein ATL2-like [Iris pallida]